MKKRRKSRPRAVWVVLSDFHGPLSVESTKRDAEDTANGWRAERRNEAEDPDDEHFGEKISVTKYVLP
jgi:hypothetical protein